MQAIRTSEAQPLSYLPSHACNNPNGHDDPIAAHEEAVKNAFSELVNALTEQIRAIEDLGHYPAGWHLTRVGSGFITTTARLTAGVKPSANTLLRAD